MIISQSLANPSQTALNGSDAACLWLCTSCGLAIDIFSETSWKILKSIEIGITVTRLQYVDIFLSRFSRFTVRCACAEKRVTGRNSGFCCVVRAVLCLWVESGECGERVERV